MPGIVGIVFEIPQITGAAFFLRCKGFAFYGVITRGHIHWEGREYGIVNLFGKNLAKRINQDSSSQS